MANIKVKFKEAYQDFGAYALLKNVTDKGVLIVDGTEVLNSIADLPTTNTVDGQEKAVIVQNGQVVTTSINNIGGESGGDFIPLSGTEVGNPVTGDIEINSGIKFIFPSGVDDSYGMLFSEEGLVGLYAGDGTDFILGGISIIKDSIYGAIITISSLNPLSKGLTGEQDFSANITDLDYTQKIYVDTHIAFTPIPTSSTDPGIKGQMAVDATYLYICVDTDTWTRVALAW